MRIVMVTGTYYPSTNGVAVSVAAFSRELRIMGHRVAVVAPRYFGFSEKETDVIRYPSLVNPWIKDYPIPLFPLTKAARAYIKNYQPDIIHVHHPFHIGLSSYMLANNLGIPLIFTYNTLYRQFIDIYLPFLPPQVRAFLEERLVSDFVKKCFAVITPSRFLKDTLQKIYTHTTIEHVPTGISFEKKYKTAKKNMLQIPKGKKIILVLSRLAPEKNIQLLLQAFLLLPSDFFLLVVGGGPQEKILKKYVVDNNLKSRVQFAGKIPHRDLPLYYRGAHVFAFASTNETQGITLLEAAYFGLPVVAVESEVSREWTYRPFSVLVKNKAESFKNGLLQADILNKAFSQKAQHWARQYSIKNCAVKLEDVYKKVIRAYSAS